MNPQNHAGVLASLAGVHVAIDDAPRIAFIAVYADERGHGACAFLIQSLRNYASLGVQIARDDRQRRLLQVGNIQTSVPAVQASPPAHEPIYLAHQLQG